MHEYRGFPQRTKEGGYLVTKDGQPFDPGPSQKIDNHSPEGFMWGYWCSGAEQLSLALLLDVTDDPLLSVRLHRQFTSEMIATIPTDSPWVMLDLTINSWVHARQILGRIHNE